MMQQQGQERDRVGGGRLLWSAWSVVAYGVGIILVGILFMAIPERLDPALACDCFWFRLAGYLGVVVGVHLMRFAFLNDRVAFALSSVFRVVAAGLFLLAYLGFYRDSHLMPVLAFLDFVGASVTLACLWCEGRQKRRAIHPQA
jgi:uncharacterized membrane protein YdcZ (DUF606 family)